MRLRVPALIAFPALVALSVVVTAAPSSDLSSVQRHLQSVESMTADFAQTDRAGKVLTGALTLKKPGKIRFQYEKSVPILIVGDGKSLWFLDYSVGQKQRWPIGNSPLGILLDPSRDISKIATVVPTGNPATIAIDAADPKHPEYGRISMVFARNAAAPGGLMLQGWVALDSQNNRTTIRLSNQRFNAAISDGAFQWRDPVRNSGRK
ncbi:LolA family protein [Sphingomonas psychrolutea]|uniref:Outer-membrane lipoprotein carrier protein n=1 Tax=Sphingomonas psychrolutea TaxID=1259676 RepID=A0ABQ1GK15_9SPHN|nr:outer membrane lipoprotein carrier protein LolA [Sphingomonas psychrolutea]GGA44948.1 outer-membrane lipoprotein carrier protein [Sphingomonas psychrolutea]